MKFKVITFALLIITLLVIPAAAQDTTLNKVSFDGFSFSFDSAVATNVNIWQYSADPVDVGPGFAEPQHIEFNLYNQQPAPESPLDALVAFHVYKTADFNGYTAHQDRLQQLQSLLKDRPDLATYMTVSDTDYKELPFLPAFPAGQALRARAQYVETSSLTGISYITVYRQDVEPLLSSDFLYTFQGVSKDGVYYVSLTAKLTTDLFPAELASDFDYNTFSQQFNNYLKDSVQKLNAAAPDSFTPTFPALESIVQSFSLSG